MCPDVANFKSSAIFPVFYVVFGKILNVLWQYFYVLELIFIVTYGQILK